MTMDDLRWRVIRLRQGDKNRNRWRYAAGSGMKTWKRRTAIDICTSAMVRHFSAMGARTL